jgi:hypothetical protein
MSVAFAATICRTRTRDPISGTGFRCPLGSTERVRSQAICCGRLCGPVRRRSHQLAHGLASSRRERHFQLPCCTRRLVAGGSPGSERESVKKSGVGDHRAYLAQNSSQNQSFQRDRSRHPSSLRYSPTPDFLTLSMWLTDDSNVRAISGIPRLLRGGEAQSFQHARLPFLFPLARMSTNN